MPLTMMKIGEHSTIKRVSGRDNHKQFLGNLGFVVGEDISVVCVNAGNYIVNVKDVRIALNSEMANRIYV